MGAVKKTLCEALILGVLGILVAVGANAVRASGSIKLTRNYFDKGFDQVQRLTSQPDADRQSPQAVAAAPPHAADEETAQHPDHPYQEVDFEEVVAIFSDPDGQAGAVTFVDARNDEAYEAGHIPGAIQADHYRLEDCIEILLDYADASEKLIVYCSGGDCEDSIFLCKDLLDFDVLYDKIYLYPGGWKEWTKRGMPVATGRE
jgi:rhodanese-related sulfurtransferase